MIWIYRIELFIVAASLLFALFNLKYVDKGDSFLLTICVLLAVFLALGIVLQTIFNQLLAAICVLAIPCFPVLLYAFFILLFIILKPDFK